MTSISSVPGVTPARAAASLVRSIAIAGLVIGVIGSLEFSAFFYFVQNTPPLVEFQYIASGLMGASAFAGGYTTALIGLLLHFLVSFAAAAVFLVAAAYISLLRRVVLPAALLYGTVVCIFMSMVVLPMSAAPKGAVTLPLLLNGLIGDAFFVGLPLAITVWWNTHTVTVSPKAWLTSDRRAAAA